MKVIKSEFFLNQSITTTSKTCPGIPQRQAWLATHSASFVEGAKLQNRKKTHSYSPKTDATHDQSRLQMTAMRKRDGGTCWTKKGRRTKNGTRAITMHSLAHLQLSSALVSSHSSCVSRTPLYKGAGSEKRNQRATKKSGNVQKAASPVTTQHPTTTPPIYCHLTRF
jgi:hypothetical protein